jgi:tRNA/tmRNA/rRNA uracil-C5-methylase (TrmA/RlmC/RlmD family)
VKLGDRLECTPEQWGFGGEGLERRPDGSWLIVAHAIPGERVLAEIVREPKRPGGAWRARVVEVLEPSKDRTDPRCPHYSRCPGCQLRHVDYALEKELKRRAVRDALSKFGGFDTDEAHSLVEEVRGAPRRDGYRVRGNPGAVTADGRPAMHPFPGSGPPVPMDECPVMDQDALHDEASGWTLPNPDMRKVLVQTVRSLLALSGSEQVLEIGAGQGGLTVECAGGARRWVGLDVDPAALEVGRQAVDRAGLAGTVELRAGRLEKVARRLFVRCGAFDVALLNPMRRPLGRAAMAALSGLGVRRCVYVGPSPVSAARDLASLNLPLRRVIPVDLYPGTYHVLVVALVEAL